LCRQLDQGEQSVLVLGILGNNGLIALLRGVGFAIADVENRQVAGGWKVVGLEL
jgi:hypothetical protein